jgi:ribonucleoside-diphosphate reductase alpha chain
VSNAARTSTGAVSFMERFSNTTREVAQKGRRGALMLTMDIAHPDVEKFITIKQDLAR